MWSSQGNTVTYLAVVTTFAGSSSQDKHVGEKEVVSYLARELLDVLQGCEAKAGHPAKSFRGAEPAPSQPGHNSS